MGERQGPFAFFAGTANPMLLVNDDLEIVNANDAACRLLRFESRDLFSKNLGRLVDPADHADLAGAWQELMTTGSFARTIPMRTSDGRQIEAQLNATSGIRPGHHLLIFVVTPQQRKSVATTAAAGPATAAANGNPLSSRETEVLAHIAKGLRAREIAREMGITVNTINAHTSNAMRKLGATSRTQAATTAIARGYLPITSSG